MTLITQLPLIGLLLVLLNTLDFGPVLAADTRPSIVLITIDTLRQDHLGFYGATRATSPFLDSLASESVVFDNAYSTSSWTVPAMASMMTGLYPTSHGVVHGTVRNGKSSLQEKIPASMSTLPEELRKLGYRTFGISANIHLGADLGFGRGFDRYECLDFVSGDQVNAAILKCKKEIESADGPFFLWLHYVDPHFPYRPRLPWVTEFTPGAIPDELTQIMAIQNQRRVQWDKMEKLFESRPRVAELIMAMYDSEIRYCDEQLRSLYTQLPLDDAWTLITADHGEEFLEHGELGHSRNLYNQTMHIPMMIRPPGGGTEKRVQEPVSLLDCGPTILSVAGGEAPRSWHGAVLLTREGGLSVPDGRRFVIGELDRFPTNTGTKAIVSGHWKLITRVGTAWSELFDLVSDPGETRDLRGDESVLSQGLREKLLRYVRSLPMPPSAIETRPITRDDEERLRRLGYIR